MHRYIDYHFNKEIFGWDVINIVPWDGSKESNLLDYKTSLYLKHYCVKNQPNYKSLFKNIRREDL